MSSQDNQTEVHTTLQEIEAQSKIRRPHRHRSLCHSRRIQDWNRTKYWPLLRTSSASNLAIEKRPQDKISSSSYGQDAAMLLAPRCKRLAISMIIFLLCTIVKLAQSNHVIHVLTPAGSAVNSNNLTVALSLTRSGDHHPLFGDSLGNITERQDNSGYLSNTNAADESIDDLHAVESSYNYTAPYNSHIHASLVTGYVGPNQTGIIGYNPLSVAPYEVTTTASTKSSSADKITLDYVSHKNNSHAVKGIGEDGHNRTSEAGPQSSADWLESEIVTNKSSAHLLCESGQMIVRLNFSEPFRGVAYADHDRTSPCRVHGHGGLYYEIRLPLRGCGTRQEAPRFFINEIVVRYHRVLELEEDEIKTVICRYPAPNVNDTQSGVLPERITDGRLVNGVPPVRLRTGYEPWLLIAGLLLFTLIVVALAIGGSFLVHRAHKRRSLHYMDDGECPIPPSVKAQRSFLNDYIETDSIMTAADTRRNLTPSSFVGQPTIADVPDINETIVHIDEHQIVRESDSSGLDDGQSSLDRESIDSDHGDAQPIDNPKSVVELHNKSIVVQHEDEKEDNKDEDLHEFDSIRATLTSPEQYKRLEQLISLVDIPTDDNDTQRTNVKFSRETRQLLNELDHNERTKLHQLLTNDEQFRSLIVESTTFELIKRKLIDNQTYRHKLSKETWIALAHILMEMTSSDTDSLSRSHDLKLFRKFLANRSSTPISRLSALPITVLPMAPAPSINRITDKVTYWSDFKNRNNNNAFGLEQEDEQIVQAVPKFERLELDEPDSLGEEQEPNRTVERITILPSSKTSRINNLMSSYKRVDH